MSLAAKTSIEPTTATPPPAAAAPPSASVVAVKFKRAALERTRVLSALGAIATATIPPLLVIALLIVVWQLAFSAPGSGLPTPTQVWADARELILDPFFVYGSQDIGLGLRVLTSLQRVAIGFGLAALVGVLIGAVIGQSVWAMRGLDPLFQVLRTVPPLAWLPISLAAFRHADPSAIFVIAITAVWPIILNTAVGIRNIPQDYRNVARVLRLNGFEFFFKVMLPATVPFMFTGLKIGIGLSWLAIVAAEMLIGGVGIGFFIWDSWNSSLISEIVLALIYVGLVGFMLDRLIGFIGNRIGGYGA